MPPKLAKLIIQFPTSWHNPSDDYQLFDVWQVKAGFRKVSVHYLGDTMNLYHQPTHFAVIGLLVFTGLANAPTFAAELANLDKSAITAIEFSLADDNLEQFGFNLSWQQLAERVNKNLAEWQFPVRLADKHFSHTLEARLDKIVHQETPVGFSFSSGNADPRAADFQKADVLPITCSFTQIGSKNKAIVHKMTFSTGAFFSDASQAKVFEKLVDQISTTCFNLLDDLKLPNADKKTDTSTFKPAWMPAVQVVVKQVPSPANSEKPDAANSETNSVVDKELIINNQGSPLTIHLGHERR